MQDHEGKELGVAGSVELLSSRAMSSQPVCSLDWSPDKEGLFCCAAFDQTLRWVQYAIVYVGKPHDTVKGQQQAAGSDPALVQTTQMLRWCTAALCLL
jgi:hypothetical protein